MVETEAETRAVATVFKAAQRGTWQAAAESLERRRRADYGRGTRLDVHVDLDAEVRLLAEEAGVDFQSAMAEAERILAASLTKRQERDLCHSRRSRLTDRHDRPIVLLAYQSLMPSKGRQW